MVSPCRETGTEEGGDTSGWCGTFSVTWHLGLPGQCWERTGGTGRGAGAQEEWVTPLHNLKLQKWRHLHHQAHTRSPDVAFTAALLLWGQ